MMAYVPGQQCLPCRKVVDSHEYRLGTLVCNVWRSDDRYNLVLRALSFLDYPVTDTDTFSSNRNRSQPYLHTVFLKNKVLRPES